MTQETFPIDLDQFKRLPLDPTNPKLTDEQREALQFNIDLCRDAIVFFTAISAGKGLAGHTGGAFDTVPETMIAYSFIQNFEKTGKGPDVHPVLFDEAGHRVATQYLMAVLTGDLPQERLLHYREFNSRLPGHPESDFTPGVHFSSGRLGHMWPFVNGVAMANPDKVVLMLGSDGSQMEGNDAEAARLCVSQNLNVKLLIDDNDVTIAGHPSDYMPGFDVGMTLGGHGLDVNVGDGEDIDDLYARMCAAVTSDGPQALINKRKMAVGIDGLEGSTHGHEAVSKDLGVAHLKAQGRDEAAEYLSNVTPISNKVEYKGSTGAGSNRNLFGTYLIEKLDAMTPEQRLESIRVFDNDLEGSCGLKAVRAAHPEVVVRGGIMERGNFSAAAGFGSSDGKQGVFATFAAFLEMCVSELTMARLNQSNMLIHFSHSGCDEIADNTCHFGVNNFFADNGLLHDGHDTTRLFFPADQHQLKACMDSVFNDKGCRFIFTNRSKLPDILDDAGNPLFGGDYSFDSSKDDLVREGSAGYVVSFGETLYRALDAVLTLKEDGVDVGLVNKCTLNIYDEEMMSKLAAAPMVLVAEGQNVKTGLGSRFGSELLKRGFKGKFNNIGVYKGGMGGLGEQMIDQGLDPAGIIDAVKKLS